MKQGYAFLSRSLSLMTFFVFMVFSSAGQASSKTFGKASYQLSDAGKFMRHWLIAGPYAVSGDSVAPTSDAQEKTFKADFSAHLQMSAGQLPALTNTKEPGWKPVSTAADIIDLDSIFTQKDFTYAYAMAEIKSDNPSDVLLAVGSDDGIMIWLNGKLVHENWLGRAVEKDDDLVPLKLTKGSNLLLMKVQDMQGGWGFTARILDKTGLAGHLVKAASAGALDQVKFLADHGAGLNVANEHGTTALEAARVAGRQAMAELLLARGATDKPVASSEVLIDRLYGTLNKGVLPGFAVLVAKDGKVLYKKGFGYANIQKKEKVTPETRFRIGSVTKQFTAAAILRLQEAGLLELTDKLSKYIPDFPRGDEVTIHHLLTHTSGIHSYTNKPTFLDRVTKTISPDSLIAFFKYDEYDFDPGENYMYNNSAYFILGYIIGKVSGMPYETYLKKAFFDPLKMTNTGVHYAGIKLPNEAKGYHKNNGRVEESINWDMSWAGGAGAMYSTLDDLLKWNNALHGGKVLSEENYRKAITPVKLNNGQVASTKYGYGLGMGEYRGMPTIGHSGGLHGFLTQLAWYPEEKMTVVLFTNTSSLDVNFSPEKVAEAFLWQKLDSQSSYAEAAIKPANLGDYNGRYEIAYVGVLTVTAEGDKLFAQISGQPRFEIFPASKDEFFWKVVEARIKFARNEQGEITHATLFQNGNEMKAARLKEEKIVEIDPAIFDQYTGKYKLNNEAVVIIAKEGKKLTAHPTGQSKLEMQPLSETEFIILEINARVKFVKGDDGKVSKMVVHMNGSNTDMPRIE